MLFRLSVFSGRLTVFRVPTFISLSAAVSTVAPPVHGLLIAFPPSLHRLNTGLAATANGLPVFISISTVTYLYGEISSALWSVLHRSVLHSVQYSHSCPL